MKPFTPQDLPISEIRWEPLIPLIAKANRAIAEYDGVLYGVPNPQVLLSPLTTQEAVLSSRIEGTRATLGDVLKQEAGEEPDEERTRLDVQEILNYRSALRTVEHELRERPFNLNLLLKLHGILLDSVRGEDKARGRFRTLQNWIGAPGSTIEQARFVPPDPMHLMQYLGAFEKYYHQDSPDLLVQLAVVHAQFEILHPFLDGNGRLGRMLIPIFLFEKKILSRPMFYLSEYLEEHRDEYVDRLHALSVPGNWNAWITFFFSALIQQACTNSSKARQIMDLYTQLKERVISLTRSQYAVPLLDLLFETPIFKSSSLEGPTMPSKQMIANMLGKLKEGGILKVVREGAGRRPQILALESLVNLCEGRQVV